MSASVPTEQKRSVEFKDQKVHLVATGEIGTVVRLYPDKVLVLLEDRTYRKVRDAEATRLDSNQEATAPRRSDRRTP